MEGRKARIWHLGQAPAGILMVLAAAVLWSTSGLFIKVLTVPAIPLTGLRALLAGWVLLPFLRPRAVRWDANLFLLMLGYAGTSIGFVQATRWTTAANAIALQSTAPAWVFLFGCVAQRRVPLRLLMPILIILAGIGVMLSEPAHGTSREGNLAALGAGLSFAVTQLAFSRIRQPGIGAICLCNLGTGLAAFLMQPGGFDPLSIAPMEWGALLFLGTIQIGLGYILFATALRYIPVGQASVLTLLEPLLNPIWVYLVLGELPSSYGFAGGGLILAGILADQFLRRQGHLATAPLGNG